MAFTQESCSGQLQLQARPTDDSWNSQRGYLLSIYAEDEGGLKSGDVALAIAVTETNIAPIIVANQVSAIQLQQCGASHPWHALFVRYFASTKHKQPL